MIPESYIHSAGRHSIPVSFKCCIDWHIAMPHKTFNLVPDATYHGKISLLAKPPEINIIMLDPRVVFVKQVGSSWSGLAKTYDVCHWRRNFNELAGAYRFTTWTPQSWITEFRADPKVRLLSYSTLTLGFCSNRWQLERITNVHHQNTWYQVRNPWCWFRYLLNCIFIFQWPLQFLHSPNALPFFRFLNQTRSALHCCWLPQPRALPSNATVIWSETFFLTLSVSYIVINLTAVSVIVINPL